MIRRLDHLVLTVRDLDAAAAFYTRVLGFEAHTFGEGRTALHMGSFKINLHEADRPLEPAAQHPTPGSADLCFITERPLAEFIRHLQTTQVPILDGPVRRTGARGPILSVYFRDPDGNLIEVATYHPEGASPGRFDQHGTLA